MRNDICTLIAVYAEGTEIKKRELQVFCSRKSAGRSEYYAAYAVGLKPRCILEIDPMDWECLSGQGEKPNKVLYRGEELNILRDYQTDETTVELTIG